MHAFNGYMIEQRICIRFFVQIYRLLPVTLSLNVRTPVNGTDFLFTAMFSDGRELSTPLLSSSL